MDKKYYCQSYIKRILDHMIQIPDDFEVSESY